MKKGGTNFDVSQGSYDGAECAELVGLFILDEIKNLDKLDPGIYRDDFLAATSATPRQGEALKKKITQIFAKMDDLSLTESFSVKRCNLEIECGSKPPQSSMQACIQMMDRVLLSTY